MRFPHQAATMPLILLCAASALLVTAPRTAQAQGGGVAAGAAAAAPAPEIDPDYHLDTDDSVSIGVTRHGDVGGTYRIPPDGMLRLPRLLTPVNARGKTCAELVSDITGRLVNEGKLVLRPGQVTVTLVSTRIRRVYVRGSAVHGSEYDLKNGWRISDLAAVMGSVPQPDRVKVRITNVRRPAPLDIDLRSALNDPLSPANVTLMEGDTLSVEMPPRKRLLITGEGPRGEREFEDWMGLKRALVGIGFTALGGTGDLSAARIIRHQDPQDLNSPATYIPVDLQKLLTDENAPEVQFQDQDTLDIPLSQKYVLVAGEVGGPRKWYLPQDRKTTLFDVFQTTGNVSGNAAIGRITVFRKDPASGEVKSKQYDLGKFYKGDQKQNPEILAQDMIYVPANNRRDPISNIWTAFGLYNLVKVFVPGVGVP